MARHIGRCLVAGLLVLVTAAMASAQGMYYQEVEKDGRIYVFNLASEYTRWSSGGQFKGDARLNYGPKGETVYFDSPAAIMLYNFKHGLPAENLTPHRHHRHRHRRGGSAGTCSATTTTSGTTTIPSTTSNTGSGSGVFT